MTHQPFPPVRSLSLSLRTVLVLFLSLLLATYLLLSQVMRIRAASVSDLEKQKAALEQKAKQAEYEAKQQRSVAERAADKIEEVSSQINHILWSIGDTDRKIGETRVDLEEQTQQLAKMESELGRLKEQQDLLIRQLYMEKMSHPDNLALFSDEPLSVRQQRQEHFSTLKKAVSSAATKTQEAKKAVETRKAELLDREQQLENYRTQQEDQRQDLADVQGQQEYLKENAEEAVVTLENRAKQAKAERSKIENQISAALSAIVAARSQGGQLPSGGSRGGRAVGQQVTRGTIIGYEGSTGFSSGPHVHFEVRANNNPVNPMPYVNNGTLTWPVRSFVITQGFGRTDYAQSGAYGGSIHTGVDLAGPYGQPVYAPADGVVIMNQYYGGYGYAWAMQLPNGLVVLLGHLTGK